MLIDISEAHHSSLNTPPDGPYSWTMHATAYAGGLDDADIDDLEEIMRTAFKFSVTLHGMEPPISNDIERRLLAALLEQLAARVRERIEY